MFCKGVYAATTVVLNTPQNGNVFTANNNVTFNCSVSSDDYIKRLSLYHNINGSLSLNSTKYFGEYGLDNYMSVLMHFNNDTAANENDSHVYDWSGNGNNATVYGATFNSTGGKFLGAFDFDGSSYMKIPDTGSDTLDLYNGTLEMWIKPNSPIADEMSLLSKMSSCDELSYALTITVDGFITLYLNDMGTSAYSPTSVLPDQWTHVTVAWNSSEIDFYINGVFTNKDESGISSNIVPNNENLIIGASRSGCDPAPFDGAIDELAIYRKMLSASEIEEHYNSTMDRNTSAEWVLTDVPDGTYKWNCLAYDNSSQSTLASSNSTFYIDMYSPPNVISIILSPNSTDDIDPGIVINVTANVTDPSNVSYVILQWKETGDWINDTMDYNNSTGLYENASITIDQTGGVYYYRVWANDTLGHSGNSTVYNITVDWDYTWTRNPSDLGTAYGFIGCSNCYIGTIIVNNTGDDILSFTLSDNQPLIDINYNVSNPFSLGPKNVTYINITADFPVQESKYYVTINITASHGSKTPSPLLQTVIVTLIPQSGGSWFDSDNVVVFNYPAVVYQGMSYNFSARLENIGNESATGVWINWTLPDGWLNTSGNLSKYIGELNGTVSGGNMAWNNITVYITPSSATAGVHNVSVNASSGENLTGSNSVIIYVICNSDDGVCGAGCSYVTDDDCTIPQNPTGGGGGVSTTAIPNETKKYEITLVIPPRFDINRNETKILSIGVNNTVKGTRLNNVHLSLSGYPQTFLSIALLSLSGIGYGETNYFDVEIRAPIYAVYAEYYLNITASGKFAEGERTTSAEKNGVILLVTHKFIGNETLAYFEAAEEALNGMKEAGLGTKQVSDLLGEMNKSMEEGNYDKVKELAEEVMNLKDSAFSLSSQIQETEKNIESIKSRSFTLPESEKMLSLAKSAFLREDYKKAGERISSTMLIFAIESGGAKYWIFLANYWWILAPMILAAATGTVVARKGVTRASLVKKLDALIDEERVIQDLIESLQKEHFIDKKIGTESYEKSMKNYENGMNAVKKKRADILSKLSKTLKFKDAVKKLDEEERRVKGLIIDSQKKYFQLGKMGKTHYEKNMKSLRLELMEVQRIRETLDRGRHA